MGNRKAPSVKCCKKAGRRTIQMDSTIRLEEKTLFLVPVPVGSRSHNPQSNKTGISLRIFLKSGEMILETFSLWFLLKQWYYSVFVCLCDYMCVFLLHVYVRTHWPEGGVGLSVCLSVCLRVSCSTQRHTLVKDGWVWTRSRSMDDSYSGLPPG